MNLKWYKLVHHVVFSLAIVINFMGSAIAEEHERAPREDLTPGVLVTCNACSLDLAAINRELSVVIDDLLVIESVVEEIESVVEIINTNVSVTESVVDIINTNVSATESVVDIINTNVSATESVVDIINTNVSATESVVDIINTNVSATESVVEIINTNVSVTESVVDIINANVSATESIVDIINTNVSATESVVDIINANVSATESVVDIINTNVSATESVVDIINTNVSATESVVDIINTNVSATESVVAIINMNVSATESVVDVINTNVSIIESVVEMLDACASTPITQASFVDGALTLSTSNTVYCLGQEVTGSITITASDVTVDLKGYTVNGTIATSGARTIIRNGKVIAPAPSTTPIADAGVIAIQDGGQYSQILNCYISAQTGTVSGVDGAYGIVVGDNNVTLADCTIVGGTPLSNGANIAVGGVGLFISGDNIVVKNCQIFGGTGSSTSFNDTATGNGGVACSLGGSATDIQIISTSLYGGWGGQSTGYTEINGVTLGSGADALVCAYAATVTIDDSQIVGGSVPYIYTSKISNSSNLNPLVTNGNGGNGINSSSAMLKITNSLIQGGNIQPVTATSNVGIGIALQFNQFFEPGVGGNGITINSNAIVTLIENCTITGGAGPSVSTPASGGGSFYGTSNVKGGGGGAGIEINQIPSSVNPNPLCIINQCTIVGGSAGDFSTGSQFGQFGYVSGNSAGFGISLPSATSYIEIVNSTITTSRGGDLVGSSLATSPNTGGNGGNGINIGNGGVTNVRIAHNFISSTGRGGNVSVAAGGTGSTGGNGGTGINVVSGVTLTEISKNSITNTGAAGTGNTNGTAGQAIVSAATATSMTIYGNFASSIASATPYELSAGAVDGTNGTAYATAAGTNYLYNIHNP